MRRRARLRLAAGLGAVAGVATLGAAASAPAPAGTVTSYLGALPDGTPVPAGPWSGLNVLPPGGSGAFGIRVPAGSPPGWSQSAVLALPAGLGLAGATAWRTADAPPSSDTAQSNVVTSWDAHGYPHTGCQPSPWGCGYVGDWAGGAVSLAAGPATALVLTASCVSFGAGGGSCYPGASWIASRIELRLADLTPPVAALDPAPGALAGGSWLTTGAAALPLTAADAGSGVYRAFLREGATTTSVPIADAAVAMGCRDARPAAGDAYEFVATAAALVPCPRTSAAYAPAFDLVGLGDGAHVVDLGVEDAAGNEAIVAHSVTIRVNAPGGTLPDPGSPCANGAHDAAGTCVARAPSSRVAPALSGDSSVGGTLTTDDGTWDDAVGATFAYGWETCDPSAGGCTPIPGESGRRLVVGAAAAGRRIRSVVTATASGGSTRAVSPLSPVAQEDAPADSGGAGAVQEVPEASPPAGSGSGGADVLRATTGARDLPVPGPAANGQRASGARNGRGADGGPVVVSAQQEGARGARVYAAPTRLVGRVVTGGGLPIADAQVDVIVHAARRGARGSIAGAAMTGDDGRFAFAVPPGPSRVYSFGYRPRLSDTTYAEVVHVLVAVRPAVSLRASRRRVRVAGSGRGLEGRRRQAAAVALSGEVSGLRPGSRAVVELQARSGRRWATFATTRLHEGRFAVTQRFTRTRGTRTYAIRALVAADRTQPLSAGRSPTVRVTAIGPRRTRQPAPSSRPRTPRPHTPEETR
jgi:hypothetical protein